MESVIETNTPLRKRRPYNEIKREGISWHKDTLIGTLTNAADTVADTYKFYLNGAKPKVQTTDEANSRSTETSKYPSPASLKYEAKRSYLFIAKDLSKEHINDILEARISELKDAIQRAPLKDAAERDGNTLGNMLELAELAQHELLNKIEAKQSLKKTLKAIATEEKTKVETNAKYATSFSLSRSFADDAAKNEVQKQADKVVDQFKTGNERFQKFIETL